MMRFRVGILSWVSYGLEGELRKGRAGDEVMKRQNVGSVVGR